MSLLTGLALYAVAALPGPFAALPPGALQVVVRQRVLIRVAPTMPLPASNSARAAPPPPIVWEEKSGPRCVPVTDLAGAGFTARQSIDLVLMGGKRIRARLDKHCPALDFYRGFYLKPNRDGMVCADRDVIRNRAGGECEIDSFRRLVPKR